MAFKGEYCYAIVNTINYLQAAYIQYVRTNNDAKVNLLYKNVKPHWLMILDSFS
ncbi:MAG: hypothetical protein RL660_1991 [Bacteroidota bacterium]|jgi:hypothetical protein